jgi:hypothetical protein
MNGFNAEIAENAKGRSGHAPGTPLTGIRTDASAGRPDDPRNRRRFQLHSSAALCVLRALCVDGLS